MAETNKFAQLDSDMEFVRRFTPPDFQARNFTPLISPNFNSFSKKKHKKKNENGEIYTAGKNFTLPPALTNSTSGERFALCDNRVDIEVSNIRLKK